MLLSRWIRVVVVAFFVFKLGDVEGGRDFGRCAAVLAGTESLAFEMIAPGICSNF